eukprot:TRINITY_DN15330_c0_g1_i1.p1 TRINITY_DN15330_c0_g1~~TRINITY_DN15330_c0_g1_i1.p1  ORF type:complete len:1151 (+),score=183.75 TRINITY_DN15330_c0_g1_i1:236-3454(+)
MDPPPWARSATSVCKVLAVDPAAGITEQLARVRLGIYGPNYLEGSQIPTLASFFATEIYAPPQILLLSIGVLSSLIGGWDGTFGAFLVILVLMPTLIAIDYSARHAVASLHESSPQQAVVVRNSGETIKLGRSNLAPGDLVLLREGMEVPADIRLIQSHFLEIDESRLTGDSSPIPKNPKIIMPAGVEPLDCANLALAGTLVKRGRGSGVVYRTGKATQLGQMLRRTTKQGRKAPPSEPLDAETSRKQAARDRPTRLQAMVVQNSWKLTLIVVMGTVLAAFLGLLRGATLVDVLLLWLTLLFVSLPEDFGVLLLGMLAAGAKSLAARDIFVTQLWAAENIGFVDTMVVDMGGTLTESKPILSKAMAGPILLSSGELLAASQGRIPKGCVLTEAGSLQAVGKLLEAWLYMSEIGEDLVQALPIEGKVNGDMASTQAGPIESEKQAQEEGVDDDGAFIIGMEASDSLMDPFADDDDEEDEEVSAEINFRCTPLDRAILDLVGGLDLFKSQEGEQDSGAELWRTWKGGIGENGVGKSSSIGSVSTSSDSQSGDLRPILKSSYWDKSQRAELVSETPYDRKLRSSSKVFRPHLGVPKVARPPPPPVIPEPTRSVHATALVAAMKSRIQTNTNTAPVSSAESGASSILSTQRSSSLSSSSRGGSTAAATSGSAPNSENRLGSAGQSRPATSAIAEGGENRRDTLSSAASSEEEPDLGALKLWRGQRQFIRGAPEYVLEMCSSAVGRTGEEVPVATVEADVREMVSQLTRQGLGLVAFAYRDLPLPAPGAKSLNDSLPSLGEGRDATFLGILALQEPVRADAADAVRACQIAGIRVVMVTEEHEDVALGVGRSIGLISPDEAKEGAGSVRCGDAALLLMGEEELREAIQGAAIFSGAGPNDKLKIVEALQSLKYCVLATGAVWDDIEVLASAHVGVALGWATDQARDAAAVVVLESGFAGLAESVIESRRLVDNLRKAVALYLGVKLGLLVLFVWGTALNFFSAGHRPRPSSPPLHLHWCLVRVRLRTPRLAPSTETSKPDLGSRYGRGSPRRDHRLRPLRVRLRLHKPSHLHVLCNP